MSVEALKTDSCLIGRVALAALLDLSPASLDRAVQAGRIPAPIRISARRVHWRKNEILTWLAAVPAETPSPSRSSAL
jgi:predicted DNA-binding transcriptional regulator AlpA